MTTRIAIIGCGAVAHAHLPVLAETQDVEVTVLVDRALERAQDLAKQHSIPHVLADFADIGDRADAAIVALPHHLHAPVSQALLEKGLHVLVEKPMALTTAECDAMIAASRASGARLAVGLASRWFASARYVKELLAKGLIGQVVRFDVREGNVYDWPVASDFMFRRDTGGGVLADMGAHVLDLALWWLGDHASVAYRDDAEGGVEAECELELEMQSGATGFVQMSRLRALRNSWILEGERGRLEVERSFGAKLRLSLSGEQYDLEGRFGKDDEPEDPLAPFHLQLADWLTAIREDTEPEASGAEGRRGVALMEACRAVRQPLRRGWDALGSLAPDAAPAHAGS